MNNNNILENKSNYLIIKDDDNFVKLFSFKSLVAKYNLITNELESIPYTFKNLKGVSCSHSSTTTRHINKFKKFIVEKYQYFINK